MDEQLSRDDVARIARDEATRVLAEATIPPYPAYFLRGHLLVTYDWAVYLADLAERHAIEAAKWQIKQSFPRWLRWLIR